MNCCECISHWILFVKKSKGTDTLEHLVNEQEIIFLFVYHKSNNHLNCVSTGESYTQQQQQQKSPFLISDL